MRYQEPEFAPWDGRRVPISFISGYLGAGKTTLINELLATADRPIAVLVNDVGAINIDARLIRRRHGDTIELTDGCICCSLSDGFGAAIDQIRARPEPPDHLVVELSGVADPSRVLPWSRSVGFMLDGVVTLVDVDQFAERMSETIPALTIEAQLSAADLILLTKVDMVDQPTRSAAERRIQDIAPATPVLAEPTVSAAALLNLGGRRGTAVDQLPPPTLFDRHVTERIALPKGTDRVELKKILDALPESVVRAKGVSIDLAGTAWLAQAVGRRRSVTELPTAERNANDDTDSELVVIRLPESSI